MDRLDDRRLTRGDSKVRSGHKPRGRHPQHRLTAVHVRALKTPGRYADGNGLYLFVEPSGAKRWIWRGVVAGKRCDLGVGPVALVSLADARVEALRLKTIAWNGGDPRAKRRGNPPADSVEIALLKAKRDAVIAKFPGLDEGDWAWAAPAFPHKKPKQRITFSAIEKAVDLAKWRAHIGMAHHNVHAGAHGAFFRLGNPLGREESSALAGPSIYGLADPGHACAISLHQLTLQLVLPRAKAKDDARDLYHVAEAKALGPLVDLCGRKFGEADRRANRNKTARRKSFAKRTPRKDQHGPSG